MRLIVLPLILIVLATSSYGGYPQLVSGTNYRNNTLGYKMLGYEKENTRFWVIIKPALVKSQNRMNKIILDIYDRYSEKFNLDKESWNISFFSNEEEAGYKTFRRQSYLAEYWSINSYDKEKQNTIVSYPAYPKLQKWYHGPRRLSKNISVLLVEGNKLKYAEKYEEAEKFYDQALKINPKNKIASQGKNDCRIMLEPIIPIQHLMVPPNYDDPEYQELLSRFKKAKTPWEKRRLEIAFDRFALKYTGRVYSEDKIRLNKKANEIVDKAIQRIKNGESVDKGLGKGTAQSF